MRGCHPRDLIEQVVDLCRYRGQEPVINRDVLDTVCMSYFLEQTDTAPASASAMEPARRQMVHS